MGHVSKACENGLLLVLDLDKSCIFYDTVPYPTMLLNLT